MNLHRWKNTKLAFLSENGEEKGENEGKGKEEA
jgi:hypothetical protein